MTSISVRASGGAAATSPAAAASPVALFRGVSYWYPGQDEPSIRDLDLAIEPGLTLVLGASGGGKSTLLRLTNGLVPQFHGGRISGSVTIAGLDAFRTPISTLATHAGLVFQDVETQSVYGVVDREVAFGLENLGMPRTQMHDRVDEALAALGVEGLRGRRLATLSGGERQRVQLAAVLALRPEIVALDEPTSQLDPEGAAQVLAACLRLARSGRAVVVAEHRLETLLPAADRILLVDGGRVFPGSAPEPVPPTVRRPAFARGGEPAWEMRDVSAGPAGRAVLAGVSLGGCAGEVVALVGPNGSGKTTLLRTLAGLLPALSGTVRRLEGRTAYLPQNPGALLYLPTLRAEVELTVRRTGSSESPDAMLAAFGLGQLADRYPRDLSSGQRQRAALAATLAGAPSLALLDEPTRGMDVAARRSLAGVVRSLTDRGSAVVIATHDLALAADLADRTIEIRDGSAVERAAAASSADRATPAEPAAAESEAGR